MALIDNYLMEMKTKLEVPPGGQDILITRDFDLPVSALFQAYTEASLLEAWMGTRVLELNATPFGKYLFETSDPKGNKHRFSGVMHTVTPDELIVRTFEMEQTSFPVQLEFLAFKSLSEGTSRLLMQIVFKSAADRENMLKLPFAQGINWAHNRLQDAVDKFKKQ